MKPTSANLARLATALGMTVVVGLAQGGAEPFFNGKDLTGWKGNDGYWSVRDGAIVGDADKNVPRNEFLWSRIEVRDFYLAVDVKLTPDGRNAGIQFRSKPMNAAGQALGYQADVGAAVWGKLYHEHGRGKLDWNDRGLKAVKRGQWNRYEILAVGHRIWLALNGKLCVAIHDPDGELSGRIAFQIHSGPPQTVRYRIDKLVHDPPLALATLNEGQLLAALPREDNAAAPRSRPGWTPQVTAWRHKLDANDPGMKRAGGPPWFSPGHDDAGWKAMALPGHWEGKGLPGCDGTVWYRKEVEIPSGSAGAEIGGRGLGDDGDDNETTEAILYGGDPPLMPDFTGGVGASGGVGAGGPTTRLALQQYIGLDAAHGGRIAGERYRESYLGDKVPPAAPSTPGGGGGGAKRENVGYDEQGQGWVRTPRGSLRRAGEAVMS